MDEQAATYTSRVRPFPPPPTPPLPAISHGQAVCGDSAACGVRRHTARRRMDGAADTDGLKYLRVVLPWQHVRVSVRGAKG